MADTTVIKQRGRGRGKPSSTRAREGRTGLLLVIAKREARVRLIAYTNVPRTLPTPFPEHLKTK